MSLPLILQPGFGRSVKIGTSTCTFKATGKDTQGNFGLFEFILEAGSKGASPHIHKQMTEMFYVVEGEIELELDDWAQRSLRDRKVLGTPGSFMLVPENTPHGFSNPGQTRLSFAHCEAIETFNHVLFSRRTRKIF
ncbi:MAG: cupin domain-containing protein [Xenococcaceae cyanobacterium]